MPTIEELPDDAPPAPPSAASRPPPSDARLTALLHSLPAAVPLSPADVDLLLPAFVPAVPARTRALAFLVLAQLAASSSPPPPSASASTAAALGFAQPFAAELEHILLSTEPDAVEQALTFVAALAQTAPAAALALVARPGLQENLLDLLELFPAAGATERAVAVPRALADVVSQLSNSAAGRMALLSSGLAWKDVLGKQSASAGSHPSLRAAATVALAKLSRGTAGEDGAAGGGGGGGGAADPAAAEEEAQLGRSDERLAVVLKGIVESSASSTTNAGDPPKAVVDAVEGLALTSYRPRIKELLSASRPFLAALFALVPAPPRARAFNDPLPANVDDASPAARAVSTSLQYGLAVILANVCAYKPVLSAEQAQIDRLRRMTLAKESKTSSATPSAPPADDPLESDAAAARRNRRLLAAGVLGPLAGLARSESRLVRETVGRTAVALVHEQAHRPDAVKAGGARLLLGLSAALLAAPRSPPAASSSSSSGTDALTPPPPPSLEGALPTFQALAKLLITASPFAIFGPTAASSAADALRPLATLLTHDAASLLQRFEALMALTNLASVGPELAGRIAAFDGRQVARKMEDLMLDDHVLVRRAATELLCNLLASEEVFVAWSGEASSSAPSATRASGSASPTTTTTTVTMAQAAPSKAAAHRLRLLLALCTVPDVPTQLAAAGALATLAGSPAAGALMLGRADGPDRAVRSVVELLRPPAADDDDDDHDDAAPPLGSRGATAVAHPGLVHRAAVILLSLLSSPAAAGPDVQAAFERANTAGAVEEAMEDVRHGVEGGGKEEIEGLLREALALLERRKGVH